MQKTKTKNFRYYLKWVLWVVVAQFILANISASIYAYKFTHFYNPPAPAASSQNIFRKTWKLFTGPDFYKNTTEPKPGFPFDTVKLKTAGGIAIDAWYSAAASSDTCVILVHGYSTNKSYGTDRAAIFRQWGYSVFLFDLRGHGASGGNSTTFGVKETDELEKACQFVKEKGYSKIILYGVSLGSAVCLKAAGENKVSPVAIIADMPFGSLHQHLKSRARDVGFPAEPFAGLTTFWIGVEKGYNGFRHDIGSYVKNVHCPVLMQWGEKDEMVTRAETERIFSNLASKNKKLVIYPEAGHASFLQIDPETWEKEIQTFLKSAR